MDKKTLYLVLGGELVGVGPDDEVAFADLSKIDLVGVYPSYAEALLVWRGKAQQTVDSAHARFFIIPIKLT